jgi:hypothetical protein
MVSNKRDVRVHNKTMLVNYSQFLEPSRQLLRASFAAVVATIFLGSPLALAGETVLGGGLTSCESYLQSDDVAKLAVESWVLGFLTSANMRAQNLDLLATVENLSIIEALEGNCTLNLQKTVTEVSVDLLKSLIDSIEGDCISGPGAIRKVGALSICHNPGSLESNPETQGFNMRVPAIE